MIAAVQDLGPSIREMQYGDVPAIVAIEADTYAFPWTATIFRDCLLAGYTSLVLEHAGGLQGYAIMSLAAAEAHLLNLCVAGHLRCRGFGRQLLHQLLGQARSARAERIYLEVRPTNQAALEMYRQAGFAELGIRRNYYRSLAGREDAMVLVRRLNEIRA
jgi:ribosomal-protein-alanine N-acetyltransferase